MYTLTLTIEGARQRSFDLADRSALNAELDRLMRSGRQTGGAWVSVSQTHFETRYRGGPTSVWRVEESSSL